MHVLWSVLALAFVLTQQSDSPPDEQARLRQEARLLSAQSREQAMQLNDLAGHLHSEADARAIVDAVAKIFEPTLPPAWSTSGVRHRVARAEYAAFSQPRRRIPEQRIVNVWNEYVREIGAPNEALVTAAEIHNLRDGMYASSQPFWAQDINRSIWTMPNIVSIGEDGRVTDTCRPLEALRVIYDLGNWFENLRGARERVRRGIVVSDEIKKQADHPPPQHRIAVLKVGVNTNPVLPAECSYLSEHGSSEFNHLLARLFDQLFPEE